MQQARAFSLLLLLSFVLCAQAFHHHHNSPDTREQRVQDIQKVTVSHNAACSICDYIGFSSLNGSATLPVFEFSPATCPKFAGLCIATDRVPQLFAATSPGRGPPATLTAL